MSEYKPTETRLRERVKGSLGEYAHDFGIDGEAAMDEWIDQALAERDAKVRADERAKLQDRIEELEKNLSYEVEQKIKLADTLRDERAKRPDLYAVPIIDPESWGWGHCIVCGGEAVTHRCLMLLSVLGAPNLARIAWCEAEECIEDRKLTEALPVTPRHVEWIDSALSSLEGGRNV